MLAAARGGAWRDVARWGGAACARTVRWASGSISTTSTGGDADVERSAVPLAHMLIEGTAQTREPLLVVPGLFGSGMNWRQMGQRAEFRGRGDVYLLTMRNHGESPHTPTMSYDDMVRDVVAFMGEKGIDKCHMVGHSMGGKVAMRLAMQHPDLVRSLAIVDVAPVPYGLGLLSYIRAMRRMPLQEMRSRREAQEWMLQEVPELGIVQFLLTSLYTHRETRQFAWRLNLPVLERFLPHVADWPLQDEDNNELVPFTGPTTIVAGARAKYVVMEKHGDAIARWLPAASVTHIADAGHWVHAEQPDKLAAAIDTFWKGLE